MTSSIQYAKEIKTPIENILTSPLNRIENVIKRNYNEEQKKGLTYFEYFDMKDKNYKLVFDIDKKISKQDRESFDINGFLNNLYTGLNDVCNSNNENWAVSCDNRIIGNKYKLSYHFIHTSKITNSKIMNKYKLDLNKYLNDKYGFKIDTSIYPNGYRKFRMIYNKKSYDDENSILIPLTYKDDFKKHLIQLIDDNNELINFNIVIPKKEDKKEKANDKYLNRFNEEQIKIINSFEIIGKIKKYNGNLFFCNINTDCEWDNHNNNNRYLKITKNTIILKCHGTECKDKEKILYRNFANVRLTTTDDGLARLFKRFYGDKFVYVENTINGEDFYYFNGMYWIKDIKARKLRRTIADDFYYVLDEIINEKRKKLSPDDAGHKELIAFKKKILNIQNINKIKSIIEMLTTHLIENITFDKNPYYLVFNNGVYDFKNDKFLTSTPYDAYISNTNTTGYDYEELDEEKMIYLKQNYLDKVFINDKADKECYFTLTSTCLYGKVIKMFQIANGCGDNAKSGFYGLLSEMLGGNDKGYAYKLSPKELCVGKKDNFELHNINNKRLVYCEEPDSETMKFDGNFLKEITGGDTLNFRKMYSASDSVIKNACLLAICCNAKPPINCVDNAIKVRLMDFDFKATFTNTDINNIDRFEGDKYFDSRDFKNKYKMTLFHFLKPYLIKFIKNGEKIKKTENLEKRAEEYLLESDDFYSWFCDTYKFVNNQDFNNRDKTTNMVFTMRKIYKEFKEGSYFRNLPKSKKRKITKKKLLEQLMSRKQIKKYYRARFQPRDIETGKQLNIRNCFIMMVKNNDNCDIEEDENDFEEEETK